MSILTYSELIRIPDFKSRFNYLRLDGKVAHETFGFDRYLNQRFYASKEWKKFRRDIIIRDGGFDMAHKDFPIPGRIIIHHLNPIAPEDLENSADLLLDPNNVVCVSEDTHNAIHYGVEDIVRKDYTPRRPGDTKLW